MLGRGLAVFVTQLVVTRVLGKREPKQLSVFDSVVAITIGAIGAQAIIRVDEPLGHLWLAIVAVALYGLLAGLLSLKSPAARRLLEGEPTVLIQNGRVLENNMRRYLDRPWRDPFEHRRGELLRHWPAAGRAKAIARSVRNWSSLVP